MSREKTAVIRNKAAKKIKDFRFNENVSFYSCETLDSNVIKSFFADLSKDDEVYCRVVKESIDSDVEYSFIAYKKTVTPSCFDVNVSKNHNFCWNETKIAYLLLVEYRGFLAVCKKNVSLPKNIRECYRNVRYQTLLNFLLSNATSLKFTKLAMKNLDISENAMRSKTFESDNLEKSFSPYGTSLYSVSSFRTEIESKRHSGVYSVAVANSRINKTDTEKQDYINLIGWVKICIDRIIKFEKKPEIRKDENLLSYFAKPIEGSENLECESILITKDAILNFVEENDSAKFIRKRNDDEGEEIKKEIFIENDFILYESFDEKTFVKRDKNGFVFQIDAFQNIFIKTDDVEISVHDFIEQHQSYVLSFKNNLIKYTHGTFFDTTPLVSCIPVFKKLFESHSELNGAKYEKGPMNAGQREFDEKSVFYATNKIFKDKYEYFICDDLGTEYADHIGIDSRSKSSPTVAFFIEKGGQHKFSASAFQVVVAQAQKNIGNLVLNQNQKKRLCEKYNPENEYKNAGAKTDISRTKGNERDAIETWLNISKSPFLRKKIFIVVNFITVNTVDDIFDEFERMEKNEKSVENYSVAKQMLWMIASLHNFCIEHNVELKIICPEKNVF